MYFSDFRLEMYKNHKWALDCKYEETRTWDIRLNIPCKSSIWEILHMEWQGLFSQKNNNRIFSNAILYAASRVKFLLFLFFFFFFLHDRQAQSLLSSDNKNKKGCFWKQRPLKRMKIGDSVKSLHKQWCNFQGFICPLALDDVVFDFQSNQNGLNEERK